MSKLIATLVASAAAASPALAQDEDDRRSISVFGSAGVTVVNDTAGFSTGVSERRSTPNLALRAASLEMQQVLGALRRAGVSDADLRTTNVSVRRVYRDGEPAGHLATQSVAVTVRAIDTTGGVMDAAVQAGADRLSGPRFWAADTSGLYRQALAGALRRARDKAQALAAESGASLGEVLSISESGADVVHLPASAESAPGGGAKDVTVRPGRSRVRAELTAVFALT